MWRRVSWARGGLPTRARLPGNLGSLPASNARVLEPRFVAQDDCVAVQWRHKAENRETGECIDLPAAGVYRFVDGMVVDSRMFHFDIAALLKFLNNNASG